MTPEERQALREKHREVARSDMWFPIMICDYCSPPANPDGFAHGYPCDTIKLLDVLDGGNPSFSDDLLLGDVFKPLLNVTPQPLIEPEVIKDCASHAETQKAYLNFWDTMRDLSLNGYRRRGFCDECGEELRSWADIAQLHPENLKFNDLKTEPEPVSETDPKLEECDHVVGSWIPVVMKDDETWLEFTYCPKCGEKL